jgi:hypothetical protein
MGGSFVSTKENPFFTLGVLDILKEIRATEAILDRGTLLLELYADYPKEKAVDLEQMLRDYVHEELTGILIVDTDNAEASSRAVTLLNRTLRIFPDDEEMVSYAWK